MYKVLKAETLAAKIHLMVVHAPRVASHCLPGQFIIVKLDEKERGSRLPSAITIARPVQLPSYSRRSEHLPLRCPH